MVITKVQMYWRITQHITAGPSTYTGASDSLQKWLKAGLSKSNIYILTRNMVADMLTNALPKAQYYRFMNMIGLRMVKNESLVVMKMPSSRCRGAWKNSIVGMIYIDTEAWEIVVFLLFRFSFFFI